MKKGFTLVEMLIVVVVLVTLMSITFRLSSIAGSQDARNSTVNRLQRIENCLSGYYAAFGTYPPVPLHGSRDYNLEVNSTHGFQGSHTRELSLNWYKDQGNHGIGSTEEDRDWRQVEAACRSQPFAMRFPFEKDMNEDIKLYCEILRERAMELKGENDSSRAEKEVLTAEADDGYTANPGRHELDKADWTSCHLFQFGTMSFLLPRYSFMLNGPDAFFRGSQWMAHNQLPLIPLGTGERYGSWIDLKEDVERAFARQGGDNKEDRFNVKNIPTQAICARWMPNLEGVCACRNRDGMYTNICYGIDIRDPNGTALLDSSCIFSPEGKDEDSNSNQFALDFVTVRDGWGHDFYYYSPNPHQSYTVWSAGPNGRTFPPWGARDTYSANQNKAIGAWIQDDMIHMSN